MCERQLHIDVSLPLFLLSLPLSLKINKNKSLKKKFQDWRTDSERVLGDKSRGFGWLQD